MKDLTLEAIKLLKDWSSGLVIMQTAAIGYIGTLLDNAKCNWTTASASFSILFFLLSILASAQLIAGLPSLVEKAAQIKPTEIYQQPGNHNWMTFGLAAFFQGLFFVLGIVLLIAFIFLRAV